MGETDITEYENTGDTREPKTIFDEIRAKLNAGVSPIKYEPIMLSPLDACEVVSNCMALIDNSIQLNGGYVEGNAVAIKRISTLLKGLSENLDAVASVSLEYPTV